MELPSSNDPDGVVNLETTVLAVLSQLSKPSKTKKGKFVGVSCKSIAEFLQANYFWIDGDIESQVMTALLSCIKAGLVCALVSGKYRPIGANVRDMPARCLLRPSHGPRCSCLKMLKCFSKSYSQVCCILQKRRYVSKKKNRCLKKRNLGKTISLPSQKITKRRARLGKKRRCCVQSMKFYKDSITSENEPVQGLGPNPHNNSSTAKRGNNTDS